MLKLLAKFNQVKISTNLLFTFFVLVRYGDKANENQYLFFKSISKRDCSTFPVAVSTVLVAFQHSLAFCTNSTSFSSESFYHGEVDNSEIERDPLQMIDHKFTQISRITQTNTQNICIGSRNSWNNSSVINGMNGETNWQTFQRNVRQIVHSKTVACTNWNCKIKDFKAIVQLLMAPARRDKIHVHVTFGTVL